MKVHFTEKGWEEYVALQMNDRAALRRINLLICEIQRDPYAGIGQPEALRHKLSGYWSRRIDRANRLVYSVEEGLLTIVQCSGHY